jgi:Lrp/AsnC family leucine-responsive transcriptional regulator
MLRLDDIDWQILDCLQEDARMPIAALGRVIGLGSTATTERVNRLVNSGVITGFHAAVDPARLGFSLQALIRLRPYRGTTRGLRRELQSSADVLECHHVTGEDCYVVKVAARDMEHLESITESLSGHGETTTSMIYSSPVRRRHFVPPATPADDE